MNRSITSHELQVIEFMKVKQLTDPERYKKVCDAHPVLSSRQWRRIREREVPLTSSLAVALGLESGDDESSE